MLSLFERIQSIRLMAIAVYDRAVAKKMPQPQIQSHITPLIQELDREIEEAVTHRIAQCVQALYQLEQLAYVHRSEAKRQMEKVDDVMVHVDRLKDALLIRMEREQATHLREGDSTIILNRVDGKNHITYR